MLLGRCLCVLVVIVGGCWVVFVLWVGCLFLLFIVLDVLCLGVSGLGGFICNLFIFLILLREVVGCLLLFVLFGWVVCLLCCCGFICLVLL